MKCRKNIKSRTETSETSKRSHSFTIIITNHHPSSYVLSFSVLFLTWVHEWLNKSWMYKAADLVLMLHFTYEYLKQHLFPDLEVNEFNMFYYNISNLIDLNSKQKGIFCFSTPFLYCWVSLAFLDTTLLFLVL